MLKICSKCKEEKQFPKDFKKSNKNNDGSYRYLNCCKCCYNKQKREYMLKTGRIKTPRGTPKENLVGKKFGKLTVIKYQEYKQCKTNKNHIWLCKCECGNFKELDEGNLKNNHTESCGCAHKRIGNDNPHYTGHKDISGTIWGAIKQGAIKRNLEFDITIEYAWELFEKQNGKCALSGVNISFAKTSYEQRHSYTTASLDRIDNSKEYTEDNVQWVHKNINHMKWILSQEKFIEWCKLVSNNNS